jgi:hypothetical protein
MNTVEGTAEEVYRDVIPSGEAVTVAVRSSNRLDAIVSVLDDCECTLDVLATDTAVCPLSLPNRDFALAGRVFDYINDGQLRVTVVDLPHDVPDVVTETTVGTVTRVGSTWQWWVGDHDGSVLDEVDALRAVGEQIDADTPGRSEVSESLGGQVGEAVADEFDQAVESCATRGITVDGVKVALVAAAAHGSRLDAVRDALEWSDLASAGTIADRKDCLVGQGIVETHRDDSEGGRPPQVLALADDLGLNQALERVL